jgi:hypothetical protein
MDVQRIMRGSLLHSLVIVKGGTRRAPPRLEPRSMRASLERRGAITGRALEMRESAQRFENWKLARALRWPYFLRSTTRASRVRKPSFFNAGRSSGS